MRIEIDLLAASYRPWLELPSTFRSRIHLSMIGNPKFPPRKVSEKGIAMFRDNAHVEHTTMVSRLAMASGDKGRMLDDSQLEGQGGSDMFSCIVGKQFICHYG
jgi:hypothetical protein